MNDNREEERILEDREERYVPFEEMLENIESLTTENEPNRWWISIMLSLQRIVREVEKGNTIPEITTFVDEYFPEVQELLINETTIESQDPTLDSHKTIHALAEIFKEEEQVCDLEIEQISLQELSDNYDDINIEDTSNKFFTISIFSHRANKWYSYPIPKSRKGNELLHKGGLSRVVLKIVAGAPQDTIDAELPLNDVDFLAKGEISELYEMAEDAGADKDGVEIVEEINYPYIFISRDLDLNGCLLGENGLIFSKQAFEAAKKSEITILANKRGLYGTEFFHFHGIRLIKNRGMMRLFKTIAEGKAREFKFLPLNKEVDLGIYWLILANKFADKPNAGLLLDRLFYLGKQTGQILDDEETIFDVLNRVHTKLPFFNFDGEKLDDIGLARWLIRKLIKQIDKVYRDENNIPTYFSFQRKPNDTIPYSVSLSGHKPNTDIVENFDTKWKVFILKSRGRYRSHKQELLDQFLENDNE